MQGPLKQMMSKQAQPGRLCWMGLRSERRGPIVTPSHVDMCPDRGLLGDRYQGRSGTRQVTLFQWEHLAAIAAYIGWAQLDPALLRRNLGVQGLNLLALKGKDFYVGEVLLRHTGACHPCSRMEEVLGTGGYNAMRGHGGITAQVLRGGQMAIGDAVSAPID